MPQAEAEELKTMVAIPPNKRRSVERVRQKRIVLFAEPGVGKTFLANTFPDVLFLNTDGNDRFYDAPAIRIMEEANKSGKTPWEIYQELTDTLTKENTEGFRTICVDLLNHVYEYCRHDFLKEQDWIHEDDAGGYGKGYKLIGDKFKPVWDKLNGSDYEWVIWLVHEKTTQITKRMGPKYDVIAPKLQKSLVDDIASKVDFIGRVYVDDDGTRKIRLEPSADMGTFVRLKGLKNKEIPATFEAINALYDHASETEVEAYQPQTPAPAAVPEAETPEQPKRRMMKRKDDGE